VEKKRSSYQFSSYNLHLNVRNDFFVYNTLFGSLARVSKNIDCKIKNEDLGSLKSGEIRSLLNLKVLHKKKFNETDYIKNKIEESKNKNLKTHILLTTTLACNCACQYCFEGKVKPSSSGSINDFDKIIKFIKKTVLKNKSKQIQIDFFGGEPLLRIDVVEKVIKDISIFGTKNKIGAYYRFYTNGTIMSKRVLNILKSNKKNMKDFQITIDGPQKIHDSRRPLKGRGNASSFNLLIKSIKVLVDNRLPVKIRMNIDRENAPFLRGFLRKISKYRWSKSVSFYLYSVKEMADNCAKNQNILDDLDYSSIEIELWREMTKSGLRVPLKPRVKFIYCSAFNKNAYVIDYLGDVYKCAVLQQNPHFKIGYINNKGNLKLINERLFKKWLGRSSLNIKVCKNCKFMPTCASGCAGSAYFKYGSFDVNNCAGNKKLFTEKLKLYIENKYF